MRNLTFGIAASLAVLAAPVCAQSDIVIAYLQANDEIDRASDRLLRATPAEAGLGAADYIDLVLDLGQSREAAGDVAGAEAAYLRALAVAEDAYGAESLKLRPVLQALGDLKAASGDAVGAEEVYLRSLKIAEAELGDVNGALRDELDRLGDLDLPEIPGPKGVDPAGDYIRRSLNITEKESLLATSPTGADPARIGSCADASAGDKAERIDVFYGSNRRTSDWATPARFFRNDYDRGAPLKYGVAKVSLPCERELGSIPQPELLKLEFRANPAKHAVLESISPHSSEDVFWSAARKHLAASDRKEALVFFHGFNTDFTGAALRAAQLAADTEIDGAPFLFDWASKGSLLSYNADRDVATSEPVVADAASFIEGVAAKTGASRIIVIAHSMGNEPLLRALAKLSAGAWATLPTPPIAEAVFAAPDVNIDNFKSFITPARKVAGNLTLYASRKDRALAYSGWRADFRRAGDAREKVAVDGLVSVDTTGASAGFIGHDDFTGNGLDDLRAILWFGARPESRCVLRPVDALKRLWAFRPGCEDSDFKHAVTLLRRRGLAQAVADLAEQKAAVRAMAISPRERRARISQIESRREILESLHRNITPTALGARYAESPFSGFDARSPSSEF